MLIISLCFMQHSRLFELSACGMWRALTHCRRSCAGAISKSNSGLPWNSQLLCVWSNSVCSVLKQTPGLECDFSSCPGVGAVRAGCPGQETSPPAPALAGSGSFLIGGLLCVL